MEKTITLTAIATVEIKDLQMRVISIKPFEFIQSNFPQLETALSKGNFLSLKEAFEKPKSWVLIPNSENMVNGLETLQKLIDDYIYTDFEKNKKDLEKKLVETRSAAPSESGEKKAKELSAKKKIKPNVLESLVKKYNLTETELYEISDTDMFTVISRLDKKTLFSYKKDILHLSLIIENKNAKDINDIFLIITIPSFYLIGTHENITFEYKESILPILSENYKMQRKLQEQKQVNEYVISLRDLNRAPGLLEQGDHLIINTPIIIPSPKPTDAFSLDISLKMFQFPAGNPLIVNLEPILLPIIHKRNRFSVSNTFLSIDPNNNCRIKLKVVNYGDPIKFDLKRELPIDCAISAISGVEIETEKTESKQYSTIKFGLLEKDASKEAELEIHLNSANEIVELSRGW